MVCCDTPRLDASRRYPMHRVRTIRRFQSTTLLLTLACSGGAMDESDLNDTTSADAGTSSSFDGGFGSGTDAMPGEGAGDGGSQPPGLDSTLSSTCAELQGRAVVNFNGNLGIAFTDGESPYTFRGSIQFELPTTFGGSVPNPENWDGASPRTIVALTSSDYALHGNHCWFDNAGATGSAVISDYRPSEGIVKAQFDGFSLRGCASNSVCTLSGSIETAGLGVYE